jgi:hypothetical protein
MDCPGGNHEMKKPPTIITTPSPADLVRQCREQAGHATIYAAHQAAPGVSLGTLHRIEHGQQDPSVGCLAGLLQRLGWRLTLTAEKTKEE